MKYKVGDKVRIREDLKVGKRYGGFLFGKQRAYLKGMKGYIKEIYKNKAYKIIEIITGDEPCTSQNPYLWTDEMLELVQNYETITENQVIKYFSNRKMKRVYIAMPYRYDPREAKEKYKYVVQALTYMHQNEYIYISTIPLFDYICNPSELVETNIMGMAYTLIDGCDELWQFGNSKGVLQEVSYAKTIGKTVRVMK